MAHRGQGRGEPIQEIVAQEVQGAEHHLDQESAVGRGFGQHAADPGLEVLRVTLHFVDPGAGKRQVGAPRFEARDARRQVAHQFARLSAPVGAPAPGSLRDYLLQPRA